MKSSIEMVLLRLYVLDQEKRFLPLVFEISWVKGNGSHLWLVERTICQKSQVDQSILSSASREVKELKKYSNTTLKSFTDRLINDTYINTVVISLTNVIKKCEFKIDNTRLQDSANE